MKKIMFNDKYGLTEAVLEGRKTQTRRVVDVSKLSKMQIDSLDDENSDLGILTMGNLLDASRYKVGEEVALAQSYKEVCYSPSVQETIENELGMSAEDIAGFNNKMFVRADLMPYRIKITNVRVERLQDISEEDCLKEGFAKINVNNGVGNMLSHWEYLLTYEYKLGRSLQLGSRDHKEAFGILIDKTCGNGTWERNPYVFVYDFVLIK